MEAISLEIQVIRIWVLYQQELAQVINSLMSLKGSSLTVCRNSCWETYSPKTGVRLGLDSDVVRANLQFTEWATKKKGYGCCVWLEGNERSIKNANFKGDIISHKHGKSLTKSPLVSNFLENIISYGVNQTMLLNF